MIPQKEKIITQRTDNTGFTDLNITELNLLLNSIQPLKINNNIENERINALKERLSSATISFKNTYRELLSSEIKIININTASDAINDRNNLVKNIHTRVIRELGQCNHY